MGQHTLLPRRQVLKKQTAGTGRRSAPVSHRRPRTPGVGAKKVRNGMAAVAGLAVGFVLSVLAGVLLAVHGPSDSSAAGRPSLTLRPEAPAVPKPAKAHPAKPAEPDSAKAKPAKVKKIVLLPGATLWELAHTQHDREAVAAAQRSGVVDPNLRRAAAAHTASRPLRAKASTRSAYGFWAPGPCAPTQYGRAYSSGSTSVSSTGWLAVEGVTVMPGHYAAAVALRHSPSAVLDCVLRQHLGGWRYK
ncbi:hypothetical protein [Streptomyces sp. NRRL S-337]|uniref:hypothetical protein n=1 Tax=Streptomyces sp. NRRL S-337 TaxID=1463900 RepID=UPI00131DE05F|nr:hypothetical protein [Streptomyces sp. NRRL S-337]